MLNSEERGRVEQALLRERGKTLEGIGHFDERVADLRDRAGELSLYRVHPADVGTESQDQEQDFLLASVEGRHLYEIDEALDRLYHAPETFGTCVVCGREIGVERLEVIPETTLCAEHALRKDVADGVDADPREAFRAGDSDAV
jgi:RNA polymerase-binding transcription factor DksA